MTASGSGAGDVFEQVFQSLPLETYVRSCDKYELAPLFRELLPERQPILEAGSGSGRWVVWFGRQGWRGAGLDWSALLCASARRQFHDANFVAGDMSTLPFDDGSFGSVVALGSIEHEPRGPVAALHEFHRVLRPGGVAIVTVPFGGFLKRSSSKVRELQTRFSSPARLVRESAVLRRMLRKAPLRLRGLSELRGSVEAAWAPVFTRERDGWNFFEYQFTPRQIRKLVVGAGFSIEREWIDFHEQGLLANFGPIAGRWLAEESRVEFSRAGRMLRRLLPVGLTGQMLCFIARRSGSPSVSLPSLRNGAPGT